MRGTEANGNKEDSEDSDEKSDDGFNAHGSLARGGLHVRGRPRPGFRRGELLELVSLRVGSVKR